MVHRTEDSISPGIRLGAVCWSQFTTWPELLEAGRSADRLGYDTLWTWNHLYPIIGSDVGPIFDGWMTISAWAQATERVRIGLLVAANSFQNPAISAKMATTLDHISGGRAILGIGSGWFATEHVAFGVPFGDGPTERLNWLGEALPIIRGMLRGEMPSASGGRYSAHSIRNDPAPLQSRLPILVGGGGERVTLRLVARFADANNVGGSIELVRRKEAVLVEHCEQVGRDPAEIERTVGVGPIFIRDNAAEAERAMKRSFELNGRAAPSAKAIAGTPELMVERLQPYVELGYRHIITSFPAPYDQESMDRLATQIRPALQAPLVGSSCMPV